MAKRMKSWSTRIVVLSVLFLAVFGGWTLYKQNQQQVDSGVEKVTQKVKQVGEVLKD